MNEVQNLRRQNEADQKVYLHQFRILLSADEELIPAETKLSELTTQLINDTSQISRNPLLAYQRSLQEITLQEKRVEANRALPDLVLGYFNQTLIGYQKAYNGSENFYDSKYRFSGFMAGVAIPLWFIPYNARIKSASWRAASQQYTFNYYKRQLQGQWEKAIQEFIKNRNSLDYYHRSALPNARLILSQSQLSYRTGEISQAEYRLNLQQALSIEEGYLQSLLQYNLILS